MKQVSAQVISNEQILGAFERAGTGTFKRPEARNTLGSWIIWLKCPEIALEAKPGQFVMVSCGGECVLPRPFSIHQVNNDDVALFFAVWEGGKGTRWLSQRHKGDTVEMLGPLGKGFFIDPASKNLLLVAGGIGIAPLCFLAQQALNQGHSVRLLLGAATATQLYPRHLLPPQVDFIIATEDGTVGQKGMITNLLADFVDLADQIFACGPVAMYREMHVQREKLLKVKPTQVSLEMRMGCGHGVCYGCTIKTKGGLKQVCKDGPIFNLDDILWDELDYQQ